MKYSSLLLIALIFALCAFIIVLLNNNNSYNRDSASREKYRVKQEVKEIEKKISSELKKEKLVREVISETRGTLIQIGFHHSWIKNVGENTFEVYLDVYPLIHTDSYPWKSTPDSIMPEASKNHFVEGEYNFNRIKHMFENEGGKFVFPEEQRQNFLRALPDLRENIEEYESHGNMERVYMDVEEGAFKTILYTSSYPNFKKFLTN
ncbi:hypothetical protein HOD29_02800 [archaeon]|jgi:hypothetical protein|nr:hypothetical protein [archaeon]